MPEYDGQRFLPPAPTEIVSITNPDTRSTPNRAVLVLDQEVGVLGRDVLNHVRLILDGPRLEWDSR